MVVWYARGGGIAKIGPYTSEVEAWKALRYSKEKRQATGYDHPPDSAVWPVEKE